MEKVLFIGSLNTKSQKFDGERIKTTFLKEVLENHFVLKIVNLSRFKIINTIKFILLVVFRKKTFRYCVVSKDRGGAALIHKLLYVFRFNMKKVVYFQVGPFLYDLINEKPKKKKLFISDKAIIVETKSLASQLQTIGFTNVDIVPNFKPRFNLEKRVFSYPKPTLKLIYLSRIEEMKGIYQLLDTLIEINKSAILFETDIFGIFMTKDDKKRIKSYSLKHNWIRYQGTISLNSIESYKKLQEYDLHVFPTLYGEGFPGSIIDAFIAGVPTLSSTFERSSEIFNGNEVILFEQNNIDDLRNKLIYIYNNQKVLNEIGFNAYKRGNEYSLEILEKYIEEQIN